MLSFISKAMAQGITNPVIGAAGTGEGGIVFGKIISAVIGFLLIIGFVIAFLHLMLGAFAWITSSGDKAKLEQAQNRITSAIVGLIIMAAIWAIMLLVSKFLGIDFPNIKIPTVNDTGGSETICTSPGLCTPGQDCTINGGTIISGTCPSSYVCCDY